MMLPPRYRAELALQALVIADTALKLAMSYQDGGENQNKEKVPNRSAVILEEAWIHACKMMYAERRRLMMTFRANSDDEFDFGWLKDKDLGKLGSLCREADKAYLEWQDALAGDVSDRQTKKMPI